MEALIIGRVRLALAALVVANLGASFLGLLLPFGAVETDSQAPWSDEMRRVAWVTSGAASAAIVLGVVIALFSYARGKRLYILAVSMMALWLPFSVSAGYLWYLFNHTDGTIGGPAGFWMLLLSGALLVAGVTEALIAVGLHWSIKVARELAAERAG